MKRAEPCFSSCSMHWAVLLPSCSLLTCSKSGSVARQNDGGRPRGKGRPSLRTQALGR